VIQFSKKMIEKVYEIRRLSPPELRGKIKLTSATLFEDLEHYYQLNADSDIRLGIEDLFALSGKSLATATPVGVKSSGFGQNVEKSGLRSVNDDVEKPKLRKIIYRGQVTT